MLPLPWGRPFSDSPLFTQLRQTLHLAFSANFHLSVHPVLFLFIAAKLHSLSLGKHKSSAIGTRFVKFFFSRALLPFPRADFLRPSKRHLLHPTPPGVSPLLQPIQGSPVLWLSSQGTWLLSRAVITGLCVVDIWAQP